MITEPEVIEKCAKELEDMEVQLKALEDFITPYEWKEYKVFMISNLKKYNLYFFE